MIVGVEGRHERSYDDRFFAYTSALLPVLYLPVTLWAEGRRQKSAYLHANGERNLYPKPATVALLAIH